MANCPICGKKIGMFDNVTFYYKKDGEDTYTTIDVCSECGNLLSDAKNGEEEACKKISEVKMSISNKKVVGYINEILRNAEKKIEENKAAKKEKERITAVFNSLLVTSGYNFEGYKITEYKNMVSGECALGTGFLSEFSASVSDLFGSSSSAFSEKMYTAKEEALKIMKNRCAQLGCNAIIGVDYDYITFTNNMIGVIANGTAVKIEKL